MVRTLLFTIMIEVPAKSAALSPQGRPNSVAAKCRSCDCNIQHQVKPPAAAMDGRASVATLLDKECTSLREAVLTCFINDILRGMRGTWQRRAGGGLRVSVTGLLLCPERREYALITKCCSGGLVTSTNQEENASRSNGTIVWCAPPPPAFQKAAASSRRGRPTTIPEGG